jgi:protein arginine kinase activator
MFTLMKCESCQKNEATIHLTQVVNGVVKKVHICEPCAKGSGLDLNSPISITDILLGLGDGMADALPAELDVTCPACHLRKTDFKKNGRLGCEKCYETFMGEVQSLVNAMHRSNQHVGKIPARAGSTARLAAETGGLQKKLEQAVAREDFEQAARLRDQIQQLRNRAAEQEAQGEAD